MSLLKLNNWDYFLITVLLGLIFAIVYRLRRQNPTSDDYFLANRINIPQKFLLPAILSIGLIEFIGLSAYGGYAGLNAWYIFVPIFFLTASFFDNQIAKSNNLITLFINPATNRQTNKLKPFISVIYAVFMLFVAAFAIDLLIGLFKILLAWQWSNTALILVGICLVGLAIGAMAGVIYGHFIGIIILLVIMLGATGSAFYNSGYSNLIHNITQAALSNGLKSDVFIKPALSMDLAKQTYLALIFSISIVVMNPLYYLIRNKITNAKQSPKLWLLRLLQSGLIALIIAGGIFSLATPAPHSQIAGNQVITLKTKFADGSLGYIVKSVPKDDNRVAAQRGLIARQLIYDDEASEPARFDYFSAAIILVEAMIPLAFICLYLLLVLFFKTINESLSFITLLMIRGFFAPHYNKSGEDQENLWAARFFAICVAIMAIALGLVLFKYASIEYVFAIIALLSLPIAANLVYPRFGWRADLAATLLIIISFLIIDIPNTLSLVPLIKVTDLFSFVVVVSLIVGMIYLVNYVFNKIRSN